VSSLTVHEADDGDLTIAVLPQGQPAAESFLIARYRIYQWGVFHHKVVQVGKALELVTAEVLGEAFSNPSHRLHDFATEVATLADPGAGGREAALRSFAEQDDVWWLSELRQHTAPSAIRELVLARRPGPLSLWKRVSEFPGGPAAVEALNSRLPQRGDAEAERAWQQLERDIRREHGVILSRVLFTPIRLDKTTGQSLLRVGDALADSRPLSELSPLISALPTAWATDLQVFAFTEQHVDDCAGLADTVRAKVMATIA
jgi:HD superfamily phosphohydrolase